MKRNLFVSIILVFLFSIIIFGCSKKGYRSIKVFNTSGNVDIVRNKKTIDAVKDMKLKNNDKVIVDSQSNAVLKLDNDKYVMVKENTTLTLQATGKTETSKTRIVVDKGGVVVEVKEKLNEKESFEIASSNSVMAIRGTQISFEVEVKDNKITTSVAVLEGSTQILLYKDQKLSSTTLTKDFRLSYTTELNEVAKDISKVIRKGKVEEINDTVLENVFNVVKEELSSEEIDDIVDTINTFDRDDDLVNGVIKFKFKSNPEYGNDPKDYIEIEEAYRDLFGLKYTYSNTIDGEYKEFDLDNPLEVGTYYCKITAGNAYRSDPLEFNVISTNLNFSYADSLFYGTNPSTEVVLEDNSYKDIKYLYSKSIDGTYSEYDIDNPLEVGKWYLKITYNNKETNPVSFDITKRSLNLSMGESTGYMINPKTVITPDKTFNNLTYVYSSTLNGTYSEYDPYVPLGLGTWYCKVIGNDNYDSNTISFDVVTRDLEFKFDYESKYITNNVFLVASISDLDEFFNSPLASTLRDEPEQYPVSDYKYYLSFYYGDPDDSDNYHYPEIFDYGNRSIFCSSVGYSWDVEIYIDLDESSLPEEGFNYVGKGIDDYDYYRHDDYLGIDDVIATKSASDDSLSLYATLNWFSDDYDNKKIGARIYSTGEAPIEVEPTRLSGEVYRVDGLTNNCDVQFYMTNTEIQSAKINVKDSNFASAANTTIEARPTDDAILTYNGNSKMNIYYDLGFSSNEGFKHFVLVSYLDSEVNLEIPKLVIGTNKYAVLEDTDETRYSVLVVGAMKEVNGMYYLSKASAIESNINDYNITYGYMTYDEEIGNSTMHSYEFFERGNGYELDVLNYLTVKINTVTDDDFIDDNSFEKVLVNYNKDNSKITGMAYGYISPNVIDSSLVTEHNAFTDDAFEYVKTQLSNEGITIKGTNMHHVSEVDFDLV